MTAHADAYYRYFCYVAVDVHALVADVSVELFEHNLGVGGVTVRAGEDDVLAAFRLGGRLDDHVDVDASVGKGAENRGGDARMVLNADQGELGFVPRIGDAADDLLFHDLF